MVPPKACVPKSTVTEAKSFEAIAKMVGQVRSRVLRHAIANKLHDAAEGELAASVARTFAAYEKSMPVTESMRQQMLRASAARALISPDGAPKGAQPPRLARLNRGRSPGGERGSEK